MPSAQRQVATRRKPAVTAFAVTLHTNVPTSDPKAPLVARLLWEYLRSHVDGQDDELFQRILAHKPNQAPSSEKVALVWQFNNEQWLDFGSILYGILCGALQRIHQHMPVEVYLPPNVGWVAPGLSESFPGEQYEQAIGKPLKEISFRDVIPCFVALLSYRDRRGVWTEID